MLTVLAGAAAAIEVTGAFRQAPPPAAVDLGATSLTTITLPAPGDPAPEQ